MPKSIERAPIVDSENPQWTKEKFAKAKRIGGLPPDLQTALRRKPRGPQKAPTKELISLRLSADVLKALRSEGRGWQTLVDETLRRRFVKS